MRPVVVADQDRNEKGRATRKMGRGALQTEFSWNNAVPIRFGLYRGNGGRNNLGLWPVDDKVLAALELILGFANLDCWDILVPVAKGEGMRSARS
jgi:hypothetical protein